MRRVIAVALVLWVVALAPGAARAQSWQPDSVELANYENDLGDAASAMRMRILAATDRGLGRSQRWALSPCTMEQRSRVRAFCWTSYGRNLRLVLPKLAYNALAFLRPHTLYSYKSVDLRFPPAVRVRLPFDATTTVGYEYDEDMLGIRLRLSF